MERIPEKKSSESLKETLKRDTAKAARGAWDEAKPYLIIGIVFTIIFLICSAA